MSSTTATAENTTMITSTLRKGGVIYCLRGPYLSHADSSEHQLLTIRLITKGLALPSDVVSTIDTAIATEMPVRLSEMAFYRLEPLASAIPGRSYQGEFEIMLPMTAPKSGDEADTAPVIWDTSSLNRDSWWGDVPATDFTLTRSPDGSPHVLSVQYESGGKRGELPEGYFFLKHCADRVGYQPVESPQPMRGNTTLASPIFLTSEGNASFDAHSGTTFHHGDVLYFVHPSLPPGKRWLTLEEEEAARLSAA